MYVNGGTATFTSCYIYDNEAYIVRLGPSCSMAPMEEVSRKRPSRPQGGGVYVDGGTATFINCEIFENTATGYVRLCPTPFHGPHGRSFPELTISPCDAMPCVPTRCRMYAAARYAPFHGPH